MRVLSSHDGHWLARLPETRLLASFWGSMLAVDVGRSVGASGWVSTLLVGGTVGLCSLGQRPPTTVLTGVIGWLFVTGFLVNEGGELALTGRADLGRLVVLLAFAQVGSAVGRHRMVRRHPDRGPIRAPAGRSDLDRRRTPATPVAAELSGPARGDQ